MAEEATSSDRSVGFTITRVFEAPPERVWKAFTQPDQFAQWFGGADATVSDVAMDVRVGGEWRAIMHLPDAPDISWAGEYREVDEPSKLVLTFKNPSNHNDPNREVVTVVFTDQGGKTQIVYTQQGNMQQDEYGRAEAGTQLFLDSMEELLKKQT
ncbi:MAG: ATPase [Candidatus Saccharibacteria bacterium]|nr:ATPase [Candidatus Saccharibacteria bacterium]